MAVLREFASHLPGIVMPIDDIDVHFASITMKQFILAFFLLQVFCDVIPAQDADTAKVKLGSKTARNGFRNEDEIRDKFNRWNDDLDAQAWLAAMDYEIPDIKSVTATKPHGKKADVEVNVITESGQSVERISVKLVSSPNGFNQIDKRWVATYSQIWTMPPDVVEALKLYVGETPPHESSRNRERMFLDEFDETTQKSIIDFFTANRDEIISDLFAGDGVHAADWMMVTFKASDKPKWLIRSSADAIRFFGDGDVEITQAGNLKIGRISMQRKGGDNGRETANMLQFKINPVQLFEAKESEPE